MTNAGLRVTLLFGTDAYPATAASPAQVERIQAGT